MSNYFLYEPSKHCLEEYMKERQTYSSGEWVPESKASIHIYDSQFMFGDGVFEMVRTFNHKFFLLDEHIDRLFKSMKFLDIPITKTKEEVRSICQEAFDRNAEFFKKDVNGYTEECRLMLNVSRGPLGIYKEVFELQKKEFSLEECSEIVQGIYTLGKIEGWWGKDDTD